MHESTKCESWGRFPRVAQDVYPLHWQDDPWPQQRSLLPRGLGRSYGDSCLNEGGILLDATPLNRFISFDTQKGVIRCEGGTSLAEVLKIAVPAGWFLPVTPGTKFVTVGGAIANDVHGKNHHRQGSFGCHVRCLELLRSDGTRLLCSETEHNDWFRATIGGLGLTGLILWAEFQLIPITTPWIEMETLPLHTWDDFFQLAADSDQHFDYTVAWIDGCQSPAGRGIFFRGNHANTGPTNLPPLQTEERWTIPCNAPNFLLNRLTLKAFNQMYYRHACSQKGIKRIHFDPFFYPLDAIGKWNRLYGRRGFLQYQFVVPQDHAPEMLQQTFETLQREGLPPFLTVLKIFGNQPAPGMLSFPRPGVTLALDFPNQPALFPILNLLDDRVSALGGAVYPAKDARMSTTHFQNFFPNWAQFCAYIDPKFSSSFWRRVTAKPDSGKESSS